MHPEAMAGWLWHLLPPATTTSSQEFESRKIVRKPGALSGVTGGTLPRLQVDHAFKLTGR